MKRIESIQNPFIKNILKLRDKSRERKKQGVFVVEGKREIQLAIRGGYEIISLLYVTDFEDQSFINQAHDFDSIQITPEIYQKIAYRESSEGIIAIVKSKALLVSEIKLSKKPLVLVAEGIEKPGNIGAILRTADAANIDAVLIANPKCDLYNPNVIRSSVGCVFTNQVAVGSSNEIIDFLEQNRIRIFSATLQNSNDYSKEDYTESSAIVVGTEATGLTDVWRKKAFQNINIPMEGQIDSMNVSVSAAIILFEAKRQRKNK